MTQSNSATLSQTISELFDTEVREYSVYANKRGIPSVVDGFKPSQRKAIYGGILKAPQIPKNGIKVSQLANFIAEQTHYHHGEGSLSGTVVGLAQDFPGANNLNYFKPLGQFGSRLSPQAAADRYIFTDLSDVFHKVFIKEDNLILEHNYEDGDKIEPIFFLPILPNVLINGAQGMGTGFSTNIYAHNPEDLKQYILNTLRGKKQTVKLKPWYRGFKGKIEQNPTNGQVTITGKIEKVNSTTLKITELPIGTWEDNYKNTLFDLQEKRFRRDRDDKEGYVLVKDFDNDSSAEGFVFDVKVSREVGYEDEEELLKKFQLIDRNTQNFTVWLPDYEKLHKFDSAEELTDFFIIYRVQRYDDRRLAMVAQLSERTRALAERMRFIRYYLANPDRFHKKTRAELLELLATENFVDAADLVQIQLYKLTTDEVEKLQKEIDEIVAELTYYQTTTPEAMYIKDLERLDLKKELQWPIKKN